MKRSLLIAAFVSLAAFAPSFAQHALLPEGAASLPVCKGSNRAEVRPGCVVDGDTFWWRGVKYRLACIDSPEMNEKGGLEARHFLARMLASNPLIVDLGIKDSTRARRPLAMVYVNGRSVEHVMVELGLARFGDYRNTEKQCGRGA